MFPSLFGVNQCAICFQLILVVCSLRRPRCSHLSPGIVTSLCCDLPSEAFRIWYQVIYLSGQKNQGKSLHVFFFLIRIVGGESSLVHSALRPLIGQLWLWWRIWRKGDWQGKPKYSEKTHPRATLSTINPNGLDPGSDQGRRGGKPATNRLSYGAAKMSDLLSSKREGTYRTFFQTKLLAHEIMYCLTGSWTRICVTTGPTSYSFIASSSCHVFLEPLCVACWNWPPLVTWWTVGTQPASGRSRAQFPRHEFMTFAKQNTLILNQLPLSHNSN
jgi:hypothetical protein